MYLHNGLALLAMYVTLDTMEFFSMLRTAQVKRVSRRLFQVPMRVATRVTGPENELAIQSTTKSAVQPM